MFFQEELVYLLVFKTNNNTKSQFNKGHISWCKGKRLSKDFCKKVTEGKLKSEYRHSIETRKKLSMIKGEKTSNYIDGRSKLIGYPTEWNKLLREQIINRDNGNCKWFNDDKCGKRISVHHIDYNKINCNEKNLITLCLRHNVKANYDRGNCIKIFNNYINNIYE